VFVRKRIYTEKDRTIDMLRARERKIKLDKDREGEKRIFML
jgi:hypothetical protein